MHYFLSYPNTDRYKIDKESEISIHSILGASNNKQNFLSCTIAMASEGKDGGS